jgi:N-dimethylarginine dimethylaminohydrolase
MGLVHTPSHVGAPAFVMNFPLSVSNRFLNNELMKKHKGEPYNYDVAFAQYMALYRNLTQEALVYLLPSEDMTLQDLPYVANVGMYLPHIQEKDIIVLSNFTSYPRLGEERIAAKFFQSMNYHTIQCPYRFEGEADIKFIKDNLYIGGYGIRTERTTYEWMEDRFEMEIIPIRMSDKKLYHFDCMFFKLDDENALVTTEALSPFDIGRLERVINIIPVPKEHTYSGWTNNVRLGRKIFHAPDNTESERDFMPFIENLGWEAVCIGLSEFAKSGSGLSCMLLHLNFNNYQY